ncbi:spore coat protein U domain-containing protein [Bradyrhizobium sp. USDA 4341]
MQAAANGACRQAPASSITISIRTRPGPAPGQVRHPLQPARRGANTCVLGTGTALNQNISVYGRVPPQTSPPPGAYADTIVVTVTF